MAGANSNISLVGLDFNSIKDNFTNFLKSQDTFKDYNFEGAGLNTLLDVLSYNTQYNAFYLNMVANEMFLDTSLQRASVISHAKLLDYVPSSAIAPAAFVDISVSNVTDNSLTLPAYTNFLSESIDGVNYNFVTTESLTVNVLNNTATFNNVEIKQGIPVKYKFTVDSSSNPSYTFILPDNNIDTSTISVVVYTSSYNTTYQIYNLSDSYSVVNGTSSGSSFIYFLQEGLSGNYEIYFGDGVIGNKLNDGNVVSVSYLVTQGQSSYGANNFVLMDSIPGFVNTVVYGNTPASQGAEKETIESIKFQAPKSYASQNRGVTKDDYITLIKQNKLGITFDAVNVWGGQENNPPVYGQVFISVKPSGGYTLTSTQKQRLLNDVISPLSLMTVVPNIIDPDYVYMNFTVNVLYDPKKTINSSNTISNIVTSAIQNYAYNNLNTFNSTFSYSDLIYAIQTCEQSILSNEVSIKLQKKIYPNLTNSQSYNLYYGTPLKKGYYQSGVNSSPAFQILNTINNSTIDGVYIEEVPSATGGVSSVTVLNSGYSYQYTPTVTILGDGTGATASAVLNTNGTIRSINVTASGNNYTSALVSITPADGDTTGSGSSAVALLEGQYGTLRTYYYNSGQVKTIINPKAGTIDYVNGIITLNSFNPIDVDNPLGELTITSTPDTTIISSSQNRIITLDTLDPSAITVNVIAKS